MNRPPAALILAAGSSSRLGEPKQLIEFEGESLMERTIRIAHEAGASPIFVVLGSDYERMLEPLQKNPFLPRILINKAWHTGMASSIRLGTAAAERVDAESLLVLSCDQPAVTPEHLLKLVETSNREHVVASHYLDRRGIPALFPEFAFHALQDLDGDMGARELMQNRAVLTVSLEGGQFDVDTPEDLIRLRLFESQYRKQDSKEGATA